jgi:hypothetical protein
MVTRAYVTEYPCKEQDVGNSRGKWSNPKERGQTFEKGGLTPEENGETSE